eukprot:4457856-Pyramimonas_sp.AAC.1
MALSARLSWTNAAGGRPERGSGRTALAMAAAPSSLMRLAPRSRRASLGCRGKPNTFGHIQHIRSVPALLSHGSPGLKGWRHRPEGSVRSSPQCGYIPITGPIRRRQCGYIPITDQSDAGSVDIFP